MKNVLFTILFLILASNLMAQDDLRKVRQGAREVRGTTREVKGIVTDSKEISKELKGDRNEIPESPAKSYIKKFWEYIGKMEAAPEDVNILGTNSRAAGTAINNIKMKDKNYDVSPLEAELAKWSARYNEALQGRGSSRDANNALLDLLTLLYKVDTHVPPADVEKKQAEIQTYKQKTAELVAMNLNPADKVTAANINSVLPRIKSDLSDLDNALKRLEQNLTSIEDERNLRAQHTILHYELAHWDALRKGPFAEKAALSDGYNKVTNLVTRMGSVEDMIKAGNLRRQQRIANTKMPPAIVQNAELEKLFRQSFEDAGWNETILKIHLLDRDWKAIRNDITGVLEARTIRAAIASKDKTGAYTLYNYFTIQQDYLGNSFSSQAKIIYHESTEILPENIK